MPQETNLNVAPYFDDFDPQNNYHKVLFKPAFPVQTRELTGLQSILQNQIEEMGNHFFKEGAKVIPGNLSYLDQFQAIQIQPSYLGIPVGIYLDQLVGKRITGATSGISAEVVTYITNKESERGNYTLYVNYRTSADTDLEAEQLFDNEVLLTDEAITYATTFIAAGEGFSRTIASGAAATASAFALSEGVYFLRGYFVNVATQLIILDQYDNKPSYQVGLTVQEDIISSDIDPTLADNAKGFNNFTAPGADRLKITATLSKVEPNETSSNFVMLAEVVDGALRTVNTDTEYNILGDELAKRTFEESGHYYVKEFVTSVKDSLNDYMGNRGVFTENQLTPSGNTPSEDLGLYKISPGSAYVNGYRVEILNTTFLDFKKPRSVKTLENQAINFGFGPTFTVNNVYGSPTIGFNTTNTLSLRDERVGSDPASAAGAEIGKARIYDFALESGSYDTSVPTTNKWDLSLWDLQVYTTLTVNANVTLTTPVFVEGDNSGATGYLRSSVSNGTTLSLYDVQGDFHIGERIRFNGSTEDARTLTAVRNFEISDVKSVFGTVGAGASFSGDLIQKQKTFIGVGKVKTNGEVTRTAGAFPGIVTTGNLIRYSDPALSVPSFARVTTVNTNNIVVEAVQDVAGVCDGGLPSSDLDVTDLEIIETSPQKNNTSGNVIGNEALFSAFPKRNIESSDLTASSLVIRKQFTVTIAGGVVTGVSAGANEVFLPFDEERYTLIRDDGGTEVLTQDKFTFSGGSTSLTINGLSGSGTAYLITTLRKSRVIAKEKLRNTVQSVIIDKSTTSGSGVGGTSFNDGLTHGNFPFGTRVQDPIICLNVPDVVKVHAIYESKGTDNPEAPSATLGLMDGETATTNDMIIGEKIIGSLSNAVATYLVKKSDTSINFCYRSEVLFQEGEVVKFQESGVTAVVSGFITPSELVSSDYGLNQGQKGTYYDYSSIQRKPDTQAAQRKLIVYYMSGSYDTSDQGDITLVNSYNDFDYSKEIPSIGGLRTTDLIDARPRVSPYTVVAGARSPFEFDGRIFDGGQHSCKEILASDESISLGYDYYQPRTDSIFVSRDGVLTVKYGAPDDDPKPADSVSGTMRIADISLPPFLYNTENAQVKFIEHKRYQMTDIAKLEKRIVNLEYYTSLNALEQDAINQFVPDGNGNNRYKAGVFVDNFSGTIPQDSSVGFRNSVDRKKGALRPSHYTTALNLELGTTAIAGLGTVTDADQDERFADIMGSNIRRSGQVVTLDFTEEVYIRQPFATRAENVTPFLVTFWGGTVALEPETDVWIDQQRIEPHNVEYDTGMFDSLAQANGVEVTSGRDGERVGTSPIIWDSWMTTGVQVDVNVQTSTNTQQTGSDSSSSTERDVETRGRVTQINNTTTTTNTNSFNTQTTTNSNTTTTQTQERQGTQVTVQENTQTESLGDSIVDREVIHFLRTRNIDVTGTRLKPFTRVYCFFDNVDVNSFCSPKLLEIQMTSGTFRVGERVVGRMPSSKRDNADPSTVAEISFRVASANHKYGPYNNPVDTYDVNPYNRSSNLPENYSGTSTILNVDTFSLQDINRSQFFGYVAKGMKLVGQRSGAEATISELRLVTDDVGTLQASFKVPDPKNEANPVFENGRNTYRITSSATDSKIEGTFTTAGEHTFYSQGELDTVQETTLSLKTATFEQQSFQETQTVTDVTSSTNTSNDSWTSTTVNTSTTTDTIIAPPPPPDPLAQSIMIPDTNGLYVTSVDVFFQAKDETLPVVFQIREMELGLPTTKVLPYSEVNVNPKDIVTSQDGKTPTRITLEAPVYLAGGKEYALVMLSHSTNFVVWISRLGEPDVSTLANERDQVLVTEQPNLGSLFKSQNGSTWTPSQYEDLKFTLYIASFVPSGSVQFFNSKLPEDQEVMDPKALDMESREIRIGSDTIINDPGLSPGNTIFQVNTSATGNFVGYAGSATSTLTVTNPGVGYTPSASYFVFTGVALTSVTGEGLNAEASIAIDNGVAIAATITNGGKGYQVGDVLTPITVGNENLGSGMRLSVATINGSNELVVTDVQGRFNSNVGNFLKYTSSVGLTTELNYSNGGNVVPQSPVRVTHEGTYINVWHRNHGLYSNSNVVRLKDISGDIPGVKLTADYAKTSTGVISVASTLGLTDFESVSVGSTNPGYVTIGDEIISYTGVDGATLTGVTRGIDNTIVQSHQTDDLVESYQLNGVSLRRINKVHFLNEVDDIERPITLDSYYINIDMSENGVNRSTSQSVFPPLTFKNTTKGGGKKAKATYNIPFNCIVPKCNTMSPTGTAINSSVRTVSGASVDGGQGAFVDKGFVAVPLNKRKTWFDEPRAVYSQDNENTYLTALPGNKSFTLNMTLNTTSTRVSPAIDLDDASVIFISNRINAPITDYATDFRVNGTTDDPSRFFYVTENINLENPSTTVQVLLDAYVSTFNDLRVFYAVDQPGNANQSVFIPFPGYANLDAAGNITSQASSNGESDIKVAKVDQYLTDPPMTSFREYQFTAEDLSPFTSVRIKVIGTSTNSSIVPIVKNLRVLALA